MKPMIKVLVNNSDITSIINQDASSVNFTDEAGTVSDEIKLTIEGNFKKPQYQDEIKLWLGVENQMMYCGVFLVQRSISKMGSGNSIEINATAVDFSKNLKVKRNKTYENMSLKQLVAAISKRHDLKIKCDYDDIYITHLEQSNESDLHFLKRVASDYNALFSIKNDTLLFRKKIKNKKKSDDLPRYYLSVNENTSISVEHTNKEQYNSCKATWRDTKENKQRSVTVGDGEPIKHIKDAYTSVADAKIKAEACLQKSNSQTKVGTIDTSGFIVYAGGILVLSGTLEDDGEYNIKQVSHTIDSNGWNLSLEIEN
ncbi:MAG: phage tail protein [Arcobacter sp.]|nr:MAG: phage tail protein [Arcobacter sp.]